MMCRVALSTMACALALAACSDDRGSVDDVKEWMEQKRKEVKPAPLPPVASAPDLGALPKGLDQRRDPFHKAEKTKPSR